MYQCPKEGQIELTDSQLSAGLLAKSCPSCGGAWIPPEHYTAWQRRHNHPEDPVTVSILPLSVVGATAPPPLDNRAALCPDCRSYLVRGRVSLQNFAFFVERCPNCNGIWIDAGEWDILKALNLHTHIDYIFSTEWQARVRELEQTERERQATLEKMGPEIAQRLFELADLLESHPNGDFGVAYLMRRFDQR